MIVYIRNIIVNEMWKVLTNDFNDNLKYLVILCFVGYCLIKSIRIISQIFYVISQC